MRFQKFLSKRAFKCALLVLVVALGWAQQQYKKAADQAAYEAECRQKANSRVASQCISPTRPDIPLPAQG